MSIEINENMLGIWFVAWKDADWMCGAWKSFCGPEARYRFRYYKDEKAFNSRDEKSWYDVKPRREAGDHLFTDQEMIDVCSEMAALMAKANSASEKWELIRGASTFEQFVTEFRKLPFAHTKILAPKEYRVSMKEKGTSITVTVIHKETGRRASATGPASQKAQVKTLALRNLGELLYGGATP